MDWDEYHGFLRPETPEEKAARNSRSAPMENEDDGMIHGAKVNRYRSFDRLRAAVDSESGLSVHIDRDLVVWAVKEIQRLRVARDLTLAQFPSVLKTLAGIGDRLQEVSRDGE